ncbi:MAG: sugar transferase [Candidatus Puniceispirillaceae bacterium]
MYKQGITDLLISISGAIAAAILVHFLTSEDLALRSQATVMNSLILVSLAQIFSLLIYHWLSKSFAFQAPGQMLWIFMPCHITAIAIITLSRIDYSNKIIWLSLPLLLLLALRYEAKDKKRNKKPLCIAKNQNLSGHFDDDDVAVHRYDINAPHALDKGSLFIIDPNGNDDDIRKIHLLAAQQNGSVMTYQQFRETQSGRVDISADFDLHNLRNNAMPVIGFKRAIDLLFSLSLLIVTLPILIMAILLIRLESRGNAIFTQQRVGRGSVPFTLYKLRSMASNADSKGAQFASQNDTRITKLGAILRRTRIDELPQLYNVLKGDMSLIGPRPEQVTFAAEFSQSIPNYDLRHIVKPGITGWAQVTQGYAAGEEETMEKLKYDLFYIKHLSVQLDLLVIFKTIKTIFTGFGSR